MAKRRKLTAEDRDILGRVVNDLGAERVREVVLYWIGTIDYEQLGSKKGDNVGAFRFLRDILFDYHATGVLEAINQIVSSQQVVRV